MFDTEFAEVATAQDRRPSDLWDGAPGATPSGTSRERQGSTPRQTGCSSPQPVFATMEEVRHAQQLWLQLRERFLRHAAPTMRPWCVGVD